MANYNWSDLDIITVPSVSAVNQTKHGKVATTDGFTIYPDDTVHPTVNFNDSNMGPIASARHSITRRPRVGQVYPRGVRGN